MSEATKTMPHYDRTVEDVGNIVEYGHVNVLVPDQILATLFYVSALGLTRDPYLLTSTDNMWINIGTDQFHLPMGNPQVLRGVTGLVVPDLEAAMRRLRRYGPKLSHTKFSYAERDGAIDVTCPWGNRIRLHAPDLAQFGPIILGTAYVAFDTPVGTAPGIVRFYREIVGTAANLDGASARVGAGPTTTLIYRETDAPLPPYDGNHIQISLADFSGPHQRLLARGLITEESDQHQYRFVSLVDPASGELLVEMEHEVRSMRHTLYCRPLVNRDPEYSNRRFAQGREAQPWLMDPE